MAADERPALRMELAEFLSARLPGGPSHELFELASADPQMFFAELLSRHRSGDLVLPEHLLKAVVRDFRGRGPLNR
jgi:hypothetical protein